MRKRFDQRGKTFGIFVAVAGEEAIRSFGGFYAKIGSLPGCDDYAYFNLVELCNAEQMIIAAEEIVRLAIGLVYGEPEWCLREASCALGIPQLQMSSNFSLSG